MISVIINGDSRTIEDNQDLHHVLESLGIDPVKVAIERNLEIVPRSAYRNIVLQDGDRLEIVHFIGGGKSD